MSNPTIYTFNGKMARVGNSVLGMVPPPAPEPIVLPNYTVRVKYKTGTSPNSEKISENGVITLVDETNNIWDVTMRKETSPGSGSYKVVKDWSQLFKDQTNLLEIIGANTYNLTSLTQFVMGCTSLTSFAVIDTSSIPDMSGMFNGCSSLTSVPLLDTSVCYNMQAMFIYCSSLTSIPLFNTSDCTDMSYMFLGCTNVESGALALYQQASTQANVPTHEGTFYQCGSNTVTGAAELAQIPSGWKGE